MEPTELPKERANFNPKIHTPLNMDSFGVLNPRIRTDRIGMSKTLVSMGINLPLQTNTKDPVLTKVEQISI